MLTQNQIVEAAQKAGFIQAYDKPIIIGTPSDVPLLDLLTNFAEFLLANSEIEKKDLENYILELQGRLDDNFGSL
jgi:hypothetical protein